MLEVDRKLSDESRLLNTDQDVIVCVCKEVYLGVLDPWVQGSTCSIENDSNLGEPYKATK